MKLFKYSVFASIFAVSLLAGGTVVLAQNVAVTLENTMVYATPGSEVPVADLVNIRGQLITPTRYISQFKTDNGELTMWQNGTRCGTMVMKIEKVFNDGDVTTFETSHFKNPLSCAYENGIAFSYNNKTKAGVYYTRASQENKAFIKKGVLELK